MACISNFYRESLPGWIVDVAVVSLVAGMVQSVLLGNVFPHVAVSYPVPFEVCWWTTIALALVTTPLVVTHAYFHQRLHRKG